MERGRQRSLAQTANAAVVQSVTICDQATGQGLWYKHLQGKAEVTEAMSSGLSPRHCGRGQVNRETKWGQICFSFKTKQTLSK